MRIDDLLAETAKMAFAARLTPIGQSASLQQPYYTTYHYSTTYEMRFAVGIDVA